MTSTPLGPGRYTVLDFETTALEAGPLGRVIEIGVVELYATPRADETGHQLVFETVDTWETLVHPGGGVGVGATDVHGIELHQLQGAPRFAEIAGELLRRLDHAVIVAHNARFDVGYLEYECSSAGLELPPLATVCTRDLAKAVATSAGDTIDSFRLDACCARAGIAFPDTDRHRALGDARVTAALFTHLVARADELGLEIRTIAAPAALDVPEATGIAKVRPSPPTRLVLPFDDLGPLR